LDEHPYHPLRATTIKILVKLGGSQDLMPLHLRISKIYRGNAVAHGGFGQVYKGIWEYETDSGSVKDHVAIKRLFVKAAGHEPDSPMRVSF
jgi:hypothetical protein